MALKPGRTRQAAQRCHEPQKRWRCLLSVRIRTTIVSLLLHRRDPAAWCQRVTGSLTVSVSLPTWTIVAQRVEPLTALFIVQRLSRATLSTVRVCVLWTPWDLFSLLMLIGLMLTCACCFSVLLYLYLRFRSEAVCDEHWLTSISAFVT